MSRMATISLVNLRRVAPETPARFERTLDELATGVEQAKAVGSDLVAFPEICNDLWGEKYEFEPLDGPTVTRMSAEAKKHGIYVVCPMGTVIDGRQHNSSVLIGRDGGIVGVYHKNFNGWGDDGTETPVFETDFGRVGFAICFDLNFWEVGRGLCENRAELVLWPSMWTGGRMLTKWAIEFGFYMGAIHMDQSTLVDVAGREITTRPCAVTDSTGAAPLVTATLDLDRRLLHHDYNVDRLKPLFEKYGPTAAYAEWLADECLLVFGSQLPGVSSDELIAEFGLEPMRDYLARCRRDRQRMLDGTYTPADGAIPL